MMMVIEKGGDETPNYQSGLVLLPSRSAYFTKS